MCVAAERIYVQEGIWDRFVPLMVERVSALRQGPPLESMVDIGAITMPRQLEIVDELVRDALDRGARALTGGRPNPAFRGQFYEPTLLVDVDHSMRIVKEECFGPVMLLIRFCDDDDAVQLANDTAYGLGSSVFTRDAARGERFAARIRAGMTVVNDYGIAYMVQSLPFGGLGISGFGKINGREGLRACCHEHAVVTDRIPVGKSVGVHPIRAHSFGLVESAVKVIYSHGVRARATALVELGKNVAGMVADSRRSR
jgi:acyl-CoA reductase-like NAD-dependent aldehyde dehydrogenase